MLRTRMQKPSGNIWMAPQDGGRIFIPAKRARCGSGSSMRRPYISFATRWRSFARATNLEMVGEDLTFANHAPGVCSHRLTGFREPPPPAGALEEPGTRHLFEAGDPLGECALRDADVGRRVGKSLSTGYGGEVAELLQSEPVERR